MTTAAISIEHLGKTYRIGRDRSAHQYKMLRDALMDAARAPLRTVSRRLRSMSGAAGASDEGDDSSTRIFWALRDVNLRIEPGEVVGIVGRNGAGKSTLLKILSRITRPTEGRVVIRGRVGSLLEVGTGFHPELTGRENIYLNGSILGMSRAEIKRRFDEIVAFSEIEEFLDTPVKRYSSGMYVRLAFAVAAHLESEVLLVDEVLAVGDLAFQKKCLGKMDGMARGGRTVIFVSHQMNQIRRLCSHTLWMDRGRARLYGDTGTVTGRYEAELLAGSESSSAERAEDDARQARFVSWSLNYPDAPGPHELNHFDGFEARFRLRVNRPVRNGVHGLSLWNSQGLNVWGRAAFPIEMAPGEHEFVYRFPTLPVRPGAYRWHLTLYEDRELIDEWHAAPELLVTTEPQTHPNDQGAGVLNLLSEFSCRPR